MTPMSRTFQVRVWRETPCAVSSPMKVAPGTVARMLHDARRQLEQIWGLANIGVSIVGARIVGRGSRASADVYFDDGSEMSDADQSRISSSRSRFVMPSSPPTRAASTSR